MGLPKTGTTFLQNSVFAPSTQIADFGKTPAYRAERPQVYEALKVVTSQPARIFDQQLPTVRTVLLDDAAAANGRKPHAACRLLSYEGFFHPHSIAPIEIYGRLIEIFGSFKVFITIRQQFAWMASYYLYKFYRFQQGGGPSFEKWAKRNRKQPAWNAFVCCNYWGVIAQLLEHAGPECVLVQPMESLIQAADDKSVRQLAEFLGVSADGFARDFSGAAPVKQRIDELGYLLGRTMYETRRASLSDEERLQLKRLFRKAHSELKGKYRKADVPHDVIEASFTDQERAEIRKGNAALSAYLGVNLGDFGYPLDGEGRAVNGRAVNAPAI